MKSPSEFKPGTLESKTQEDVAKTLTADFLKHLEGSEYQNIIEPLREASVAIWPQKLPDRIMYVEQTKARQEKFKRILGRLETNEDRIHFMEAYGKIGHLYEVAGLLARDNFFAEHLMKGEVIPHGAAEYVKNFKGDAAATVKNLNRANFEVTFTSHPTNNNSMEVMRPIRGIGRAVALLRKENHTEPKNTAAVDAARRSYEEALDKFAKAPLVPVDSKGKDINFAVADEASQMLAFIENAYQDLGRTYRHFDEALKKKDNYDPLALHLNVRFNSWGSSGDKDGNKQVNADTTLEAAYLHTAKIEELLLKNFKKIDQPQKFPELEHWQTALSGKSGELQRVLSTLNTEYREKKLCIPEEIFNEFSTRLNTLKIDTQKLEAAVVDAYKKIPLDMTGAAAEQKDEMLQFIRRVHTFGPHMGKIEYRETSAEFGRIVSLIDPEYKKLIDADNILEKARSGANPSELQEINKRHAAIETARVERLTDVIQKHEAAHMLAKARGEINKAGFGHNFDKNPYDADAAMAYHTLKRLELARDNPTLVANHVLAECQGLSNKLELKFLMEAVERGGKKPILGIIPLYEDPEVMQNVYKIESASYDNPVYQGHLKEFAQAHPDETAGGKLTQQVQFAHSDNRRRGGPAAAVGYIERGHSDFRRAAAQHGIAARCYEGGSLSDAFRNGVRSISAMINEFSLYQFTKLTFQGGDLLNYFGISGSTERLLTRGIMHCAKHFDDPVPEPDLSKNPFNFLAVNALQGTLQDYEKNIFQTNKIGVIIANAGFGPIEMSGGNVGTRAQRDPNAVFCEIPVERKIRNGLVFGKVEEAKMAAANPDKIRTISFSELLEHAGVYPTWLGTGTIEDEVKKYAEATLKTFENIHKTTRANDALKMALEEKPKPNSAKLMNLLYVNSPPFKEVIDRMAFGISMSNLDVLGKLHPELRGTGILEQLNTEYVKAGQIVLDAMKGVHREADPAGTTPTAAMRQAVTRRLAKLAPTLVCKSNFMEFIHFFKHDWKDKNPGAIDKERYKHLLRVTHCAMDTATHGRFIFAEDPHYAKLVMDERAKTTQR